MSTTRTTSTQPTSTRIALGGLLVTTVAAVAILPVRGGEDAGFALILAAVLVLTAGLVWKFGLPAHIWAAILGLLLVLMFGSYAIAGLVDGGEVAVLLIDLAAAVGGAMTLYGAVSYVIGRRRSSGDQRR